MWEEVVSSWPIIPLSAIGLCVVIAMAGLIALLYDAGARDTGRVTQLGVALIGLSIVGFMGIGMWNMTVSIAKLATHQNAYASAPARPQQE